MTSGDVVYVHDVEEDALRLTAAEPAQVVGRSTFGNGQICAIEGQDPAAWVAVDVGSEMPAWEVYRNVKQAPFDWRSATFQKMRLTIPYGPAANRTTTDAALIAEVLQALRDGSAAARTFEVKTTTTRSTVHSVLLSSDQLPGLVFSPAVYFAPDGQVYLAETLDAVEFRGTDETIRANWIPASAAFSQWSTTAD